jgi:hypothetical protein
VLLVGVHVDDVPTDVGALVEGRDSSTIRLGSVACTVWIAQSPRRFPLSGSSRP